MALPTRSPTSWMDRLDLPNSFLEFGGDDYELYEEDGEFVLSVEMPGFDPSGIDLAWDDGVLNIAAEHEDERRSRTYHRRFRFPKTVDEDEISAEYTNGILEVRLPIEEAGVHGKEIEIEV